jgi:pimeloyl-ACP methyl ester carboxylesterase
MLLSLGVLVGGAVAASAQENATPKVFELSERLAVDGASLYLETRGTDPRAPLAVWLHGGPGGPERPLFRYFDGGLETSLAVTYWDQRGTGRSFDSEADPTQLTVARHLADLDAVVDHLRTRFGHRSVVLLGHSWGGALGLLYARDHPEKVAALFAIAPLVAGRASQEAEYEFVRDEAAKRGDAGTGRRLEELGAPPYRTAEQVLALEELSTAYGGVFHEPPARGWTLVRGWWNGLYSPWELPRFFRANRISLDAMTPGVLALDLTHSVPALRVPVFFLLGRFDRHADSRIAAAYFERLDAPRKRLLWFESSAHNIPFEEPELFQGRVRGELAALGIGSGPP